MLSLMLGYSSLISFLCGCVCFVCSVRWVSRVMMLWLLKFCKVGLLLCCVLMFLSRWMC